MQVYGILFKNNRIEACLKRHGNDVKITKKLSMHTNSVNSEFSLQDGIESVE